MIVLTELDSDIEGFRVAKVEFLAFKRIEAAISHHSPWQLLAS
jgi:hypothetical protein